MTHFAWDRVHLFGEGSEHRLIDATVGTEVFGDDDGRYPQPGTLLIFVHRGRVVHAVAATPPLYVGGDRLTYPRRSTVVRTDTGPAPHPLDLVIPRRGRTRRH